ncbi:EpsG family protein [Sutcliffiella sp. NPDC057660]|uniref:EpsG family protein n=1 Tax=Sutcliffiella sp. NPDC057660 TaxID=3346199 RepID=UPI0036827D81
MTHIIFLIVLFFSFPDLNKKLPFYTLSFSTLFLFLAIRYDFGNDYFSYMNLHALINDGLVDFGGKEILFNYLNLLIPNFFWLIAIISLFYIISIYNLIKKNFSAKDYWFSLLLLLVNPYLFLVHLSSLRQTIAICFIIFAIKFAIKRNFPLYTILVLIASGFHQSAIVLLPVYFLLNEKKINIKSISIIYGILVVLIGTPLFEAILDRILEYFPHNYTYYFNQGYTNSLRSTLISGTLFLFLILNINKLQGKEMIYGKLSLISTIISILSIKVSMIFRIGMYFEIFLVVTIPFIICRLKRRSHKVLLSIIILTIYLGRYVNFFNGNEHYIYKTILGM